MVVVAKIEDAPKNVRSGYEGAEGWIGIRLNQMAKDARDFSFFIQDCKPGCIPPDKKLHIHKYQDTLYYVLNGRLIVNVEGTEYEMGKDSFMWVPPNERHGFTKILEPTKVLEVVTRIDHTSDHDSDERPWYEEYPGPRPLEKV